MTVLTQHAEHGAELFFCNLGRANQYRCGCLNTCTVELHGMELEQCRYSIRITESACPNFVVRPKLRT